MDKIELVFDENDTVLYRKIPRYDLGKNVYKLEPLMDKEAFIKCYEKWVKPKERKTIPPAKL